MAGPHCPCSGGEGCRGGNLGGRGPFQAPDIDGVVRLRGEGIGLGRIHPVRIAEARDYDLEGEAVSWGERRRLGYECERCGSRIHEGEEREHSGQVLCEDCYMDRLSPPRTCDPWAVHTARSFKEGPDALLTGSKSDCWVFCTNRGA